MTMVEIKPVPLILPARRTRPWRTALLAAVAVWAATTVARVAVSAFAWLPQRQVPEAWMVVFGWNRWDAVHYVQIAEHGYHLGPGYPAFYPLYPILIRLFDPLLPGGGVVSALVVANLAAIGALAVLHRLAEHEFGPLVAQRATWYLAAFPTGFFLFVGYNESLFILLAVGALYAGRRGHWWLAGTLAAFSSATRLFGLLLIVPLAYEYFRRGRIGRDVFALGLVPLGLAAYSLYCWVSLGDPLAFSVAQQQWGREYTFPGLALLTAFEQRSGRPLLDPGSLAALLDAGTVLFALILLVACVRGRWRFRRDQMYLVVHAVIAFGVLTSTEVGGRAMMSAARFTLEAVAVFLVLARIAVHPLADRAVLVIGMSLHAVLLVVYMASGDFMVA
ncbi:mannosyltransferase family protein [Actinoplanes sp. G11-F43]|uniref:mannosyltransferase family protein n=1 Tax=Actinoplanes sp. G11-F43 TaxID=3424130 RepID=UPI003D35057D